MTEMNMRNMTNLLPRLLKHDKPFTPTVELFARSNLERFHGRGAGPIG